jgi:hypothetical protein
MKTTDSCEKRVRGARSRYGRPLATFTCGHHAFLSGDNGGTLCAKHFNAWYKKAYPAEYKNIKEVENTTPANFFNPNNKPHSCNHE